MLIRKNDFVLCLAGDWLEISNKHGVLVQERLDENAKDNLEYYGKMRLDLFIRKHSLMNFQTGTLIKRVAFDPEKKKYFQLQAIRPDNGWTYIIQRYDDELVYMGEVHTTLQSPHEAKQYIYNKYQIISGFPAHIYRDDSVDCTNGGISAERSQLCIVTEDEYPFEPTDLRECVRVEHKDVNGKTYVNVKPLCYPNHWYMFGGNFLYCSDLRYQEATGVRYPVPIHDRYEGE